MSGLAQLVPYFECQYPSPIEQASAVINSAGAPSGMGDYISPFGWPIPQYLTPGNMRGLGCAECGGTCGLGGGLGQGTITIGGTSIAMSAPGGYFSTADFTQWGVEEWATVAGLAYTLLSLWDDAKRHGRKARKASQAYRSAS